MSLDICFNYKQTLQKTIYHIPSIVQDFTGKHLLYRLYKVHYSYNCSAFCNLVCFCLPLSYR